MTRDEAERAALAVEQILAFCKRRSAHFSYSHDEPWAGRLLLNGGRHLDQQIRLGMNWQEDTDRAIRFWEAYG